MAALPVGRAAIALHRIQLGDDHDGKVYRNAGKQWTSQDVKQLKDLAKGNTPTGVIGLKLGRTEDAVRHKAVEKGVSLKPTNQSP